MNIFFTKENIFLNQEIHSKQEAIKKVMEIFLEKNAVFAEYESSIIKRDQDASVALGNFLALPHGQLDSEHLIKSNCVILIHTKELFYWDNEPIRFIFALALKNQNQMEFIQKAGVTFSDIDEVNKYLNKKDLTVDDLFNWIENQ
ncbi:PTS sugar transporter subunit IIA [Mycoplasma iguanae]|uniref:Mannitol-specific phosphotransferase enzyme IIA component n=1 Tax=Mycoplasma iguanae TaxID=292461 RepID=A0ABY5RBK9_9MOLU|nr:PTS sugar transporter subunit IIA [Mycoplasma iguanae]UVD81732.1 PTS sugar transporter subunit IIA [Mycoplasma iguanae]